MQADDDQAGAAALACRPRPVEIAVDACTHRLDHLPHRLAGNVGEALQPQDVVAGDHRLQAIVEARGVGDRPGLDDERMELVVVVIVVGAFVLQLVVGLAIDDVVLGADAETEQHLRRDDAVLRLDHRRAALQVRQDIGLDHRHLRRVDEVGLVQDDQVGRRQLILEQFLDRAFVVEAVVLGALGFQLVVVVGETPGGHRRAVDHRDDAVDGHAGLDPRPVEGVDQRLRQGEAGGLDDDVVKLAVARQQLFHRRDEVVGDGAADAAIGQLDDVVLRAGFGAAAAQDVAIDAEIAELVDDQRDALALGLGEHVADQRGLAGAEEAGDDGGGNFCVRHD